MADTGESPTDATMRAEVRRMLERRIDELPVAFRTVFVMREVEDMSVEETAACLSIPSATVRTRLFRARALLREALARDMDSATVEVFRFAGERCDRIVASVLARVNATACTDLIQLISRHEGNASRVPRSNLRIRFALPGVDGIKGLADVEESG